jgi:uncharacterized protein
MKVSAIAAALSAAGLLATDARPETITAELNKLLAVDKKARDEKEVEEKKAAADKAAKDADKDDPEGTNDEDMDDVEGEDEETMDPLGGAKKSAPTDKKAGDKRAKDKAMDAASVATLIAANDTKHAAAREVESILGLVSFDSADKYYKAALDKLGVDTAGVHASAFPALLKIAKDSATAASALIVGDAAAVTGMATGIKGYGRLR